MAGAGGGSPSLLLLLPRALTMALQSFLPEIEKRFLQTEINKFENMKSYPSVDFLQSWVQTNKKNINAFLKKFTRAQVKELGLEKAFPNSDKKRLVCTKCNKGGHEAPNCWQGMNCTNCGGRNHPATRCTKSKLCKLCSGVHSYMQCNVYDGSDLEQVPCSHCVNLLGRKLFHKESECVLRADK